MDTVDHIVMSGDGVYPRTFANKNDTRFKQVLSGARGDWQSELFLKTAMEYWLGDPSKCILMADGGFEDLIHPATYIDGQYDDADLEVFKQAAWSFLGINSAPAIDDGIATLIFISHPRLTVVNKLTRMAKKLSDKSLNSRIPNWIRAILLRIC
jgi:hypothetical protein